MLKQLTRSHEFVIAVIIVVVSLLVGAINPSYFSLANLFDLLRNSTIYGLLALGALIVIISGGVDVSFPAIAAASSYIAVEFLIGMKFQGSILVAYLVALPIGLLLGLINAVFISRFRLPTLIVTLGTSSMYYGFILFFVGNVNIFNLPSGFQDFRLMSLYTVNDPIIGTTVLHPSFLILLAAAVLIWFMLKYTLIGRGIFALGGNREVAERSGFNIPLIEYSIYAIVGVLASIAGITQVSLYRNASPAALQGTELDVIAAVVLGGTAITGGRGTVIGAMLGLFLITIFKSSLVLVGIPSEWQKVVIGIALVIGTSAPIIRNARLNRLAAASAE